MPSYNTETDHVTLSELDARLLVALADGRNVGYELARIAERDADGSLKIYTSNAYKALAKLSQMGMVKMNESVNPKDARQKALFEITDAGRDALRQKLAAYRRIITTAASRNAT